MTELEAAGWKKAEEKTADQVKGFDFVCVAVLVLPAVEMDVEPAVED